MYVRSPYNYDRKAVSDATGLAVEGPTMAQQQFKEECDINVIARNFGLTGKLPQNVRVPLYGDFTGVTDYQSAIHAIRAAQDSFMAMPAATRERFGNDPQKFLDFCSRTENLAEMRALGLAVASVSESAPAPAPAPATEAGQAAQGSGGASGG